MDRIIEHRVIQILRDSPLPTVPVRRIHVALVAESGPAVPSCARLVESLQDRESVFMVVEPVHPLGDGEHWPATVRAEYERALEDVGVEAGPFVALMPRDHAGSDIRITNVEPALPALLDPVRESLAGIWEAASNRPELKRAIAAALIDCPVLPIEAAG
jgi:hypothetical protein